MKLREIYGVLRGNGSGRVEASVSALWFSFLLGVREAQAFECPECGAELSGSQSGRCPECDHAFDHEARVEKRLEKIQELLEELLASQE